MSYNWKQFIKRITIKASPKAIYDAWTTEVGLEKWFLKLAQFTKPDGTLRSKNDHVQPGDKYKWLWFGYDDSTFEQNEVLLANGWDKLQFSFSGNCIVTVSIKQENGEAICELVQEMPMDKEDERQYFFIECGTGWTFYMTNLKSTLEGGLDLRNKNLSIQRVINS